MEEFQLEAASYAGLQKLDKLVVLYDSNDINLDGKLRIPLQKMFAPRYEAYGWYALVEDRNRPCSGGAAIQ